MRWLLEQFYNTSLPVPALCTHGSGARSATARSRPDVLTILVIRESLAATALALITRWGRSAACVAPIHKQASSPTL
jgi:hypothetical protein